MVDLSVVPSLEIIVTATPLKLPLGAQFPVPEETHYYHGITHGRPGGSYNSGMESVGPA